MTLPQHLQLSPTTTIAQLSSSSSSNPYLIEQLHHMLHQESTPHYQISSDYLTNPYATVTSSDRRTMATWSYDIVDACSIEREVACIAMTYFDRFIDTATTTAPLSSATTNSNSNNNKHRAKACLTSRREFQLAFITCLIIALKCRAGMQVDSDFVSSTICQGLYAEDEIIEMEHDILNGLKWRLNGPSGHEFVAGFLELLPGGGAGAAATTTKVGDTLKTMAGLQIELAMLDYDMALQKPSSIAYAAIMTALSNHVGSTTVVSLLHPVERMEWMERIALVTGLTADDSSGYTSSSLYTTMPSSPVRVSPYTLPSNTSSPSIVMCTPQHERPTFVHQVSMMSSHNNSSYQDHNVMQYCSPVSSEDSYQEETPYDTVFEEHLYLNKCFDDDNDDECCSMGSEDSDLSPVCAMFDGGLEFTTRA